MKTTFEMLRAQKNGKVVIELVVKNAHKVPELNELLDNLGYKLTVGIANRKSIFVSTPQELDAARDPILKFFKTTHVNGVVEALDA